MIISSSSFVVEVKEKGVSSSTKLGLEQNSAYRHLNRKGAFGNEGALRFC